MVHLNNTDDSFFFIEIKFIDLCLVKIDSVRFKIDSKLTKLHLR